MARRFGIVFLCQLSFIDLVSATNSTVVYGWVQDPNNGRGTFSIVSSCLLTLSLCVYTAVHLNVPRHGDSELRGFLRTARWVVFGILAPELILYVAWRQFVSACALERSIKAEAGKRVFQDAIGSSSGRKALKAEDTPSENQRNRHEWTRIHCFYANMGGFAIDVNGLGIEDTRRFTAKHKRITLTPRGVRLLAQCGLLPDISRDDIKDKSKSDSLTKFVSLLQALWMFAQICGRLVYELPVTLLEVNTLAHIVCALIIYILWWHKPKLVYSPTILRGESVRTICAYMYMSSQMSGWANPRPGILKKTWLQPEFSVMALKTSHRSSTSHSAPPKKAGDCSGCSATVVETVEEETASEEFCLRTIDEDSLDRVDLEALEMIMTRARHIEDTDPHKATRWSLASKAVSEHPCLRSRFSSTQKTSTRIGPNLFEPHVEELVVESAQDWANDELLRSMSGFTMGVVLWAVSMVYGGMHTAAWHSYFPSEAERELWRGSSILIAASGLIWVAINFAALVSRRIEGYWNRVEVLQEHWVSLWGLGSLAALCGTLYLAARAFLVIEAFISLRNLPADAYATPPWTQIFPQSVKAAQPPNITENSSMYL